jgi:hypothetical protein
MQPTLVVQFQSDPAKQVKLVPKVDMFQSLLRTPLLLVGPAMFMSARALLVEELLATLR